MLRMVFTMSKLYSNDLLAENRRLARANSSRPASTKKLANFRIVFLVFVRRSLSAIKDVTPYFFYKSMIFLYL